MSDELNDIPRWLKWVMTFIDRVGFPILAFLLMWYMVATIIEKNTVTLSNVVQGQNRILDRMK
jgi:hypothetical protein